MQITAGLVKELRERTGSGMMECKRALMETGGDIEAAVEALRKAGQAKADKKAGRTAAEGIIVLQTRDDGRAAALVEVNSETDFVAKKEDFQAFGAAVAARVLASHPQTLAALMQMPLADGDARSIEQARQELVSTIGENIAVRRYAALDSGRGVLGSYLHNNVRIGVLVELEGGEATLARGIAMHIAASRPMCIAPQDVPAEVVAKEKEIAEAQAASSGKPANIVEKMVAGRVKKYLHEVALLGQPFVKEPDVSVGQLLDRAKAKVVRFVRFEVGEGIEKKTENFADEVMAQVKGAG